MVSRRDGVAARARWILACQNADREIRAARDLARSRDEHWVHKWLSVELGQLAVLHACVVGKRMRPGTQSFGIRRRRPVASGLFYDIPPDLQDPVYRPLMDALEQVERYYYNGIDVPGWDWSRGFPPGWHASLRDRLRALAPAYKA